MTEEEYRAAQVELQRAESDRASRRLDNDLARLKIEQQRAANERSFFFRNSATIITASVSFAAAAIAASGPISQYIQKERESQRQQSEERVSRAQMQAQESSRLQQVQLESNRKWRSDAAGYMAAHKDIIFSERYADQERIRDVMALVFPDDVVDAIFRGLKARAASEQGRIVWENGRKALDQIATANESITSVESQPTVVASDLRTLVEQLNGPSRREVSNRLIADYAVDKKAVVSALVGAIQPESSPIAYRVNLYILFTLARVPGGWEGTPAQASAIATLSQSRNATDPTYAKWAERASPRARK